MSRILAVGWLLLCPWIAGANEPDAKPPALGQLSSQVPQQLGEVPEVLAVPVEGNGSPTPPASIDWKEASKFVGQKVQVEGEIVAVYHFEKVTFLKFSNTRSQLAGVIFKSVYGKFSQDPAAFDPKAAFARKIVRIVGTVKEYKGGLEIVIDDPAQITVIGQKEIKVLNWEEVTPALLGQQVTIEGTVVSGYSSAKVVFLNFHNNWTRYVAVVMFQRTFPGLIRTPEPDPEAQGKKVLELFKGKKIRATGTIKTFNERLELIVNTASDIQILPD